jgi:protoporphyrin/coproporphyrin ferrochelatase
MEVKGYLAARFEKFGDDGFESDAEYESTGKICAGTQLSHKNRARPNALKMDEKDNLEVRAQNPVGAENESRCAVLLLAHGSPESVVEVPEFLLRVTAGRLLLPQVVDEVKHRYGLIGRSPLTALTIKQGQLLQRELGCPVYVGMRNWKPLVADTLQTMISDHVSRAVVLCLAPQNSRTSVGLYRSALGEHPPFAIDFVESWHDQPRLIEAFAEKLSHGWHHACEEMGKKVPIIFTAHSVPERTITEGDPYEKQAKETASLVAQKAGLHSEDWSFAFQSQGMSGGSWLGPTVEETILALKAGGYHGVFIQPIGFLCDHVEVLYDIDIGFKEFAGKQEMRLWRAESLNDSPLLAKALADVVRPRMAKSARANL